MPDAQTECLGIWANPDTTLTSVVKESIAVGKMKSALETAVINQVNSYHGLAETKLTRRDVSSSIYPDVEMGADVLQLPKFITVVQPKARAQERFSTGDMWNAIKNLRENGKNLQENVKNLQHNLAKETEGRLKDQVDHKDAIAKLKDRLTAAKSQPDGSDLEALRLRVTQLEQQLEAQDVSKEKLNQKLKQQEGTIAELKAELKVLKGHLVQLRRQLAPIHLRALLDHSREDILTYFKNETQTWTWEELVAQSGASLVDTIMAKLADDKDIEGYRPSRRAIRYLCSPGNDVRKDGNYQAHNATGDEIKAAIEMRKQKRPLLIQLYQFAYKTMY